MVATSTEMKINRFDDVFCPACSWRAEEVVLEDMNCKILWSI
ncbi:hypothetical protein CFII64_19823 [Pseudomonas sp. CFII64]|nr:hypothetical protein CFII64_19823 [Pseudomonas sp. CFII64]